MGAFWRYLGAAVGAAVIAMTLRGGHRAMGGAFALAAGAALLLALLEPLGQAVSTLKGIAGAAQMEEGRLALSLKLLGVSFASEFAAQACRDAGRREWPCAWKWEDG